MRLFGYWRSSATYRVRIAMGLKGLDYDYQPINLLKGEQNESAYRAINPYGLVPALETEDGSIVTQSLAIMEYLEETYGPPSILPSSAADRAHARAIAATLACEAQPLMNLRIQNYLKNDIGLDEERMKAWLQRWPGGAMGAVEKMVAATAGDYCVGDTPTIADCCLIPQMFGALRFGVEVSGLRRLTSIYDRSKEHRAFQKAHPFNQPDADRGN